MIESKELNIQNLNLGWRISLGLGFVSFLSGLIVLKQFTSPDLVTIVIIFAISAIIFSFVFFVWCLIFAQELGSFVQSDETEVKGTTVNMVTTISESGDANIDRWVQRYVFTRNMFGLSVIPLLILAGLVLFG